MSWYKKENQDIQRDNERATPKKDNYVQVPSSSPIHIKSSPTQTPSFMPPSINSKMSLNDEKERQLEAKRQAIRHHKDFPVVRKRFYYLKESDIFKGFVKGKGNVRDITQWLTDNYNKAEILGKEEAERKRRIEEQERIRQNHLEERMTREYEEREERIRKQQQMKSGNGHSIRNHRGPVDSGDEDEADENIDESDMENDTNSKVTSTTDYDDEDHSPIKVRGRARIKLDASPVKEQKSSQNSTPQQHHSSQTFQSTKVVSSKPKVSILDKYKFKPKGQVTLDSFTQGTTLNEQAPQKKRKLVRASMLDDDSAPTSKSSSPMPAASSLAASFNYQDAKVPKFKNIFMKSQQQAQSQDDDDLNDMIVADDDLEKLEEKIKENIKKNKAKKQEIVTVSDDELEEEEMSDDMSEEDDESTFHTGITSIDSQILEFINEASAQDLIEICTLEPAVADLVISQRPFNTIYDISENHFSLDDEDLGKGKNRKRKTLGMRIIESTEFSLKGYRAVDSLIKTCSKYGDAINKQMSTWGVTATGTGELSVVDIDPVDDEVKEIIDVDEENDEEEDEVVVTHYKKKGLRYIKHKPILLADEITLNNYQQVGINWLNLLYQNKLSCILADEMGLGKTCQVIAFMAYLKQTEPSKGPHLVVVPASTIENWLREFNKFCPDIKVQAYYGSVREREDLRYELKDVEFDVLVTTYTLASGSSIDFKFLKNQNFNIIVYDEGHFLKNSGTERYVRLMRLQAKFRLLLTGTPLQNNLKELVSLLSFMLPKLFNEKKDDLQGLFNQKSGAVTSSSTSTPSNYNPLLSVQAISKAKTMMTPFVLRRRKDQVLQHLPAKCHEIVRCDLVGTQSKIYNQHMDKAKSTRAERERRKVLSSKEQIELSKTSPIESSTNVLMALRKASLHPLLFRIEYPDSKLKLMAKAIMNEPEYVEANQTFIFEDMQVMSDYELNALCEKFPKTLSSYQLDDAAFLASGKVKELEKLLRKIIDKRHEKLLIFSLFTQVLDVLERVLAIFKYKFVRLDGATSVDTRQDIIDQFYDDETIPIFLLSTKAGGFGINLIAANNVIIFDQSFNPHDDKQAEDRCHRVGQTKEVTVYKLIANNTIEENMLKLAENKLQLDQSISAEGTADSKVEEKTASLFEKLLFE
ncbi:helicase of the Snf2/Rad54 family [Scheffersomyces xylosifermentans]|uniref:helicase of the Snf2/Rad54 family n=1 Tax=Scheffersomyces xylosifermentans TaxID=1304137 RepID=UPI00315D25B2